MKTVIIVPCYNEEKRFPTSEFKKFIRNHPEISFLFVDDGSTDNTLQLLKELIDTNPDNFDIYANEYNMGKAESVRKGILHGLKEDPMFIGYWDSDLSTPLNAIEDLRNELVKNDKIKLILGSRAKLLGKVIERKPIRHVLGRIFATMVTVLFSLEVYDTQCGAKLFRVDAQTKELFVSSFLSKWIFDVEMLLRFRKTYMLPNSELADIALEYPLTQWHDVPGSKVSPADYILSFIDMWKLYFYYETGK